MSRKSRKTSHHQSFGTAEQLPSGKYRARYTGEDGKRYKAPKTFYTYADALAWLRNEEKLVEFGEWTPPEEREKKNSPLTVGEWLEEWLTLREADLAESTLTIYREQLNRRILRVDGKAGKLKDIALAKLTKVEVIEWWDAVTSQFGYQNYNHQAYRRLSTALNWAVDRDLIPTNPASGVKVITKPPVKRKQLPSLEMLNAVYDNTQEMYKPAMMLTLFHGLRIGEALALQRRDISDDGENITVFVHASLWRKPGEGMIYKDSPKTSAGVRTVPIFPRFVPMLRKHMAIRVGNKADAFVTTTSTGGMVLDTSFRSVLERAKRKAGYKDVELTPHYGRVFLITQLAEAGMTPAAIGAILGQKDLKTITEVYMRASEDKTAQILIDVGHQLEK